MMIIKKKKIYTKWDFYVEAHVALKNEKSPKKFSSAWPKSNSPISRLGSLILILNQPVHNYVCFLKRKSISKPYSFSQQNSNLLLFFFPFFFLLIVALPKCHLKYFAHSVIWSTSDEDQY